jgi:hypothetical protein
MRAFFNTPNVKGARCSIHKLPTDSYIYYTPCENIDCKITAAYNAAGMQKGVRCFKHKLPTDVRAKRNQSYAKKTRNVKKTKNTRLNKSALYWFATITEAINKTINEN